MSEHQGHAPTDFEDWGNACRGKACYPSRRIANGVRRVMGKRQGANILTLRAYRCRACHRIHLGNWHGRGEPRSA